MKTHLKQTETKTICGKFIAWNFITTDDLKKSDCVRCRGKYKFDKGMTKTYSGSKEK